MEDLEEKIKEIVGRVARIRPATLDEAELLTTQAVQALTKLVEAEKREVVEGFLETLWELRYEEIKPLIDEKIEEYLKKYDLEITSYGRFRHH
jgi:c-di-GMP-binding flagellar brake protein YcgR